MRYVFQKIFARELTVVFLAGFVLNAVWEVWHSRLYEHYQGGVITSDVLLQATLVDACLVSGLFLLARLLRQRLWVVMLLGGLGIAIALELWALDTGRWAYTDTMPLIPLLHTGLTPTIQLTLTGLLAFWIAKHLNGVKDQIPHTRDADIEKSFWSEGWAAKLYRRRAAQYYAPMHRLVAEVVTARKPGAVLDMACGSGDFLLYLSSAVSGVQLTGTDIAPGMVKIARAKLGAKATVLEAGTEERPFPAASFDIVTVMMALHHFPEKLKTLNEIFTLLRPGGVLVIADVVAQSSFGKWFWDVTERITGVRGYIGHYTESELQQLAETAGYKFTTGPIPGMASRYKVSILSRQI